MFDRCQETSRLKQTSHILLVSSRGKSCVGSYVWLMAPEPAEEVPWEMFSSSLPWMYNSYFLTSFSRFLY